MSGFVLELTSGPAGTIYDVTSFTEGFTFKCGADMSIDLYEWIKASLNDPQSARDGAIVEIDFDRNVLSRFIWTQGIIAEFTMPALNAGSRLEKALLSVEIRPRTTRRTTDSGGKLASVGKRIAWHIANFRLQIDGCDDGCSSVSEVEALTFKQHFDVLEVESMPQGFGAPNLVITLPKTKAREGQLEYLSSDSAPLFTLQFSNLGIIKIRFDDPLRSNDPTGPARVEMYCENVTFSYTLS